MNNTLSCFLSHCLGSAFGGGRQSPAPHSLSPPHPEIIGRHPTFSVKNHASAMKKKKDLTTCGPSAVDSVVQMAILSFFYRFSASSVWTLRFQRDELIDSELETEVKDSGRRMAREVGTGGLRVFWVQHGRDGCCGSESHRCSLLAAEAELMRT